MNNYKGFTLLELMITIVIVAILATVAIPSYIDSVRKSRRADAYAALLQLQLVQQQIRANCPFYADELNDAASCAATATLTTINVSNTSPDGHYSIAITENSASSVSYTATATAVGDQSNDDGCGTLTLTVNGANPDGLKTPVDCW